ncbi:MAG: 2-isopropylmalate synthase [Lachnospiraceae bacterium]|nr:2-isopropylmalate synthase [Lachnospiraceae bacterium]
MMNPSKYERAYFMPPTPSLKWAQKEYIEKAPQWCSVDLRDGNQALIIPMSLEEKLEFFQLLVKVGFKEIEIGFPAASETEYQFLRTLIEEDMIPEDVTIQVLTQAREHIIKKTFEALEGCKSKAIVHVYNSTSVAQREEVFKKSKEEIIEIAVKGATLLKELTEKAGADYLFEYSPESFTGTEIDYALEVCNAVIDVWQPRPDWKVIINLPATVSHSLPHVYASQIEYMSEHLNNRENVIVSVHPHNDRGTGVADTELALLAGADRVEGTLFGNGERTGNVDIITLALNMYVHGVDPKLDFSNITEIADTYERLTRMTVPPRHPYAGQLVFAAFSGSHQDAIAKGMHWREDHHCDHWTVPYLPIDPQDVGRRYEGDVIRINSQSGKGGIGYIMEQRYGFNLPAKMREDLGYAVKSVSDHKHKELAPREILEIFEDRYVNILSPIELLEVHFTQRPARISAEITLVRDGIHKVYHGEGNGRLDAVSNSIKRHCKLDFSVVTYEEHALQIGSNSQACAYVGIQLPNGNVVWGSGIHNDIIDASVRALFSAVNRVIISQREEEKE